MSGNTTCKEVCSTCKCTVVEKPISKKKDCVATIVGVLSLPENFCKPKDPCDDAKCDEDECCEDAQDDGCEKKNECVEVYRDLGECLQKAIIKSSRTC